jgi:6-phospho-beta-glucosidase
MRLVLLGGGGFRTPLIFRALLDRRDEVSVDELVLYDVDPTRLAVISAVLAGMAAGRSAPRISVSTDLDDVLRGADVVFSAIRVGGADGRVGDERGALSLGVLGQETVGAGGLTYGLRTLPVMLRIAGRMAAVAPSAWLLNFTNPAGMITQALRDTLGEKVIGICDSPIGLVRRAGRASGIADGAAVADYVGINHLGWLRSLRDGDDDVLPALLADDAALNGFEEGRLFGAELLRGLQAIPNEYLYFYYAHRDLVDQLATGVTRGEVVAADQQSFYVAVDSTTPDPAVALDFWNRARLRREQSYLAEARGDSERDEADLTGGGYEHVALDLMSSLAGGPHRQVIVNCRNGSAIPQLPPEMVVEIPGTVSTAGVTPRPVPTPLTLHQLGLISSVRAAELTLIDAVRAGSLELARLAFVQHPLIGSPRIAAALVDSVVQRPEVAALLH